jgi:hypothetical protein
MVDADDVANVEIGVEVPAPLVSPRRVVCSAAVG